MNPWDIYGARLMAAGDTKRKSLLRREAMYLDNKAKDSLSHFHVQIDGVQNSVTIINTDNLNEKLVLSMPGEDIPLGGTVEWMDNHWLISEKDASTELYTKCKMVQCNYLLRWVDDNDTIHEQWCIIEDGTKLRCHARNAWIMVWHTGNGM